MINNIIIINGKNTYTIDGDITWIELTQGKYGIIDTEDIHLTWPYRWSAFRSRKTFYVTRTEHIKYKSITIRLHREILKSPKNHLTDHKNHNGLDNRKLNLRMCTIKQNSQHRQKTSDDEFSPYVGVYKVHVHRPPYKWIASINPNGKKVHLGTYDTIEEAVNIRNAAAKKYFGEFAYQINLTK